MFETIFAEVALIVVIATVISGLVRLFKQPLIIGYIITGIITGPYFLNIVNASDVVTTFSQMGIAFLLFIAGMSLNPRMIKTVGRVSIITGIGQIVFTSLIGFFIAKIFGFSDIVSLYIAVALTFSSTIIIVKLLSDKGDLNTLYGRISMGFLLVQDVVAILILMLISSGGFDTSIVTVGSIVRGVLAVSLLAVFAVFALPKVVKIASKSQEYLLLLSIGWLLLVVLVFNYVGLSVEIGALLAGISLSVSPYHYEIKTRMNVLRDFFILFFFILLGSQMMLGDISKFLVPIVIFSIFILLGNPLIVMILMGMMRYTKRNSFLAGLTVAQISEFSLIMISMGVKMGHIPSEILSMVTVIGLVTIFGSTYAIMHASRLYKILSNHLKIFERSGEKIDEHHYHEGEDYDIILFGYDKIGFSILNSFRKLNRRFLVIDYDPEKVVELAKEGYECKYGDANDPEFLNELNLHRAKMIVSTIPDVETNLMIIRRVRELNKNSIIIVVSHSISEAMKLYNEGATYVIMPYFLGGEYASTLIAKYGMDLRKFLEEKAKHINHLRERERRKHEHPRYKS